MHKTHTNERAFIVLCILGWLSILGIGTASFLWQHTAPLLAISGGFAVPVAVVVFAIMAGWSQVSSNRDPHK